MERDRALISIRPQIITQCNDDMTEQEIFQNETLRPILKFQNHHLIQIFQNSRITAQSKFNKSDKVSKSQFIEQALKRDKNIKDEIINAVTAMMTSNEYSKYQELKSQTNKRIISMSIERLKSMLCQ